MKYLDAKFDELVGFDFYCDVASNIAAMRKKKKWSQENLAKAAKLSLGRIGSIELVNTRITLPELKAIAAALDVTVDFLIDAEFGCKGKECLYLVWIKTSPRFKIYKRATSSRMAALEFYEMLRKSVCVEPRDRFMVRLVGVPVTKEELQSEFPKRTSKDEYDALAPDKEDKNQ